MARAEENNIVKTIKKNLEKGFRLLMSKYGKALYWHIRRLVVSHADAEDAAQETFIRIFRSFGQFNGKSSFTAWIYRIATNEALRILERQKSGNLPLDAPEASTGKLMADEYVDYGDLEAVKLQKAILSLPTKQQIAFNLRYYDEMDYDRIAEITGSTAANVKANYHIAKEKIIKYMTTND